MARFHCEQDKRRADIRAAMTAMDSPMGLGTTVDVEDQYLDTSASSKRRTPTSWSSPSWSSA